jgi:septal ring factor EnvC (AmiA/AmiB activator)
VSRSPSWSSKSCGRSLDKRLAKVHSEIQEVDKHWRHLDKKASKEELHARMVAVDQRIGRVEAQVREDKESVKRIEVSISSLMKYE